VVYVGGQTEPPKEYSEHPLTFILSVLLLSFCGGLTKVLNKGSRERGWCSGLMACVKTGNQLPLFSKNLRQAGEREN